MTRTRAGQYEAELDTLRDQLIEAIRLRRLSALEAGLTVFEHMAQAIAERAKVIDNALGDRRSEISWRRSLRPNAAPDRLGPLSQALWPVIEQAILTGDPQLLRQILGTVNTLARTAQSQRDLASFSDVLVLYLRAAGRVRGTTRQDRATVGVADLTRQLLGLIQSVYFHASVAEDDQDPIPYIEVVLKQAWEMARLLIDEADVDELGRWATEYERVLAMQLSVDREERGGLGVLGQVGGLALRGWILLSWQEEWGPLDEATADALYSALREIGDAEYTWAALVADLGEGVGERLGFSWWESLAHDAGQGYWMRFGLYREDAGALALASDAQTRMSMPGPAHLREMDLHQVQEHGRTAASLRTAVSRLDKYGALGIGEPMEHTSLANRLTSIVDAMESREIEQLIEKDLEGSSVRAFREAAISALRPSKSVSGLLKRCDSLDGIDNDGDEPPELFGVHSLASKEFFVTTDVSADPSGLGKTVAQSVVRGEDRLVLESLSAACAAEWLEGREVTEAVASGVRQFKKTESLHVLVVGVLDWWIELRRSMDSDSGRGFDEPFRVDGVTYDHYRVGGFRGVLIADLAQLACYSRLVTAADEESTGDVARLSVNVISHREAQEMALAKDGALAGEELAAEQRRLQQQVRIQVFVRPLVRILEPAAGRIILPSDEEASDET